MVDVKSLNSKQQKAVTSTEGPILVLAGPGSGKTKTLTHRIAYLIDEQGIDPGEILALTFTNKAAQEMEEKVEELIGNEEIGGLTVSTFHSLGAKILRENQSVFDRDPNFSIFDSQDQLTVLRDVQKQLAIPKDSAKPRTIANLINSAKNELITPEEYEDTARTDIQRAASEIYPAYESALKENNAYDFGDLLIKPVLKMQQDQDFLNYLQDQWGYLLIDEFQDTNTAQYFLARLLTDKHQNIFAVGDDWQSIYSWRGANFRNVQNFQRDFDDSQVIKLEKNYRSTQNILNAAQEVILRGEELSEKELWTDNPEGDKPKLYKAKNAKQEAEFILQKIKELQNQGQNLSEIAVLYRTNFQSRILEEKFLENNIPYRIYGGINFYSRKEIKDALAYLTLLVNPKDLLSAKRAIQNPRRGIGEKTWEKITDGANEDDDIFDLLEDFKSKKGVREFVNLFNTAKNQLKSNSLTTVFDLLIQESGYTKDLGDTEVERETRMENLEELKTVLERYDDMPGDEGLKLFLEEVSLLTDMDRFDPDAEAVNLMTIHSVKGLEFDYVFIAGLEEGLLPHSKSMDTEDELEEERRVFYVAMARAKKEVFLTLARKRRRFGNKGFAAASRFIQDIPDELISEIGNKKKKSGKMNKTDKTGTSAVWAEAGVDEKQDNEDQSSKSKFKKGDKVSHPELGRGIIVSYRKQSLKVAFPGEGIKSFDLEDNPLSDAD